MTTCKIRATKISRYFIRINGTRIIISEVLYPEAYGRSVKMFLNFPEFYEVPECVMMSSGLLCSRRFDEASLEFFELC